MILSSADILRILGGSEIIRLSASVKVVEQRPQLSGDERLYVCISRYPAVDEFEATWTIWLEGDGEAALVVAEIKRLLPGVTVKSGAMITLTTTDFRSERTELEPKPELGVADIDSRIEELREDLQDRMLLAPVGKSGKDGKNGLDGRDGKDGAPGRDGRDGKDIDATQTELFDLKDVDQIIPLERGQVLTWDGTQWTNLYQRSSTWITGGGGGGGGEGGGIEEAPVDGQQYARQDAAWTVVQSSGGGIEEAPTDGNFYVRQNGSWVNLQTALDGMGLTIDGGTAS